MSAGAGHEGIRIVLIGRADGRTDGLPVGNYLASYNPEATVATAWPGGRQTQPRR